MDILSELFDKLALLIGSIDEKDLEDPEIESLVRGLMQVLEPDENALPPELTQQLAQIPDKIERFKAAVMALKAASPEQMKQIAQSMKASGLLQ